MNKKLGIAIASAFLAASSVSFAIAQTAPSQDSRPAAGAERRHEQRAFARPTERVEARLAYLKTALKITGAQQPQWDAYAGQVRNDAQQMEQRFKSWRKSEPGRAEHKRASAIERLERAQSFHADAVTRINGILSVEKPLYAVLSPEQKKVADEVLNPRPHFRGGPSRHERGGRGRG
jgi:hypothetical protein